MMIRWGIIGAGNIAHRFADGLKHETGSMLYAISGRNEEKMKSFREQYPCEKIYIGFENLLADENVDAVYIALPHGMHKEWTLNALKAGKAVLCEKPAVLDEAEMKEITACVRETGVLFMEAQKSRFTPAYYEIKKMLREGVIGNLKRLETSFCFFMPKERYGTTYHTQPGRQAGSLLDGGIYCASWIQDLIGDDVTMEKVCGNVRDGVDYYLNAVMKKGSTEAVLECGFDRSVPRNAVLYGTEGTITVENLHRAEKFTVNAGGKETVYEYPLEYGDFYDQIHHFVTLLKDGKTESSVMPLSASEGCARILDQIREYYTVYTAGDLKILENQEKELRWKTFTDMDAFRLGEAVVNLLPEYDNGISLQIIREQDGLAMFQFVSDVKAQRNIGYGEKKRQAVLDSGHSSAWTWIAAHLTDEHAAEYQIMQPMSGGAFPILLEDGTHIATAALSGLHEGKDHEILVRAMIKVLDKEVPMFPKVCA